MKRRYHDYEKDINICRNNIIISHFERLFINNRIYCKNPSSASASNGSEVNDGSSYGIDLTSESVQEMSDKKISQDATKTFINDTFGDEFYLQKGDEGYTWTYGDVAEKLGSDANLYNANGEERDYTWIASEADSTRNDAGISGSGWQRNIYTVFLRGS